MNKISLCMIVKNEEKVLARCLNSAKNIADEIIIVDTGSTDKTKGIASKFTNKIYDYKWNNNFSAARNYSFSLAKNNYIMWLDADDVVPKSTINKLKKIKQSLSADVYMLKYATMFAGNKPTFYFYRERLIKNCSKAIWQGAVHECITPFGKVEKLNLRIDHKKISQTNPNRNLKIYQNLIKERSLSAREQYYYGRELYDHKKYKKCISVLTNFLNDNNAWVENIIDACSVIADCYKNLYNAKKQLEFLFKSFSYDFPRANACCNIADYFLKTHKYSTAIYWYKQAINSKKNMPENGFINNFYYNYYPYLQLCCCYYYLKNFKLASHYNKKAGKYLYSSAVKNNELLLKNLEK